MSFRVCETLTCTRTLPKVTPWTLSNPNFQSKISHFWPRTLTTRCYATRLSAIDFPDSSLRLQPMSLDGSSGDRREGQSPATANIFPGGGNGVVSGDSIRPAAGVSVSNQRLRLNPNKEHKPESYDDLQLDFSPAIFSSLERYLPPNLLVLPRDDKVKFMREILLKYLPHGERNRVSSFKFPTFYLVVFLFGC